MHDDHPHPLAAARHGDGVPTLPSLSSDDEPFPAQPPAPGPQQPPLVEDPGASGVGALRIETSCPRCGGSGLVGDNALTCGQCGGRGKTVMQVDPATAGMR